MIPVAIPGDEPIVSEQREEKLPEPPPGFVDSNTYCKILDPKTGEQVIYKIIDVWGNETILRQDLVDMLAKRKSANKEDEEMPRKREWPSDEDILRIYEECGQDVKVMAKRLDKQVANVRKRVRLARKSQQFQEEAILKGNLSPVEPQAQPAPDPEVPVPEPVFKPQEEDKPVDAKECPTLVEQFELLKKRVDVLHMRIKVLETQILPKTVTVHPLTTDIPAIEVIAAFVNALLENEKLRRENHEIKALVRQGITPRFGEEADE